MTELLNTEWLNLKEILSQNINLDNTRLCSYIEGEDDEEYGIRLTARKEVYEFTIQNSSDRDVGEETKLWISLFY